MAQSLGSDEGRPEAYAGQILSIEAADCALRLQWPIHGAQHGHSRVLHIFNRRNSC